MSLHHFYAQAKAAHSIIANAASTRQAANPNEIIQLLADLESHGVTIANADKYRDLVNYEAPTYQAPDPFTATPAEAHLAVTENGLRGGEATRRIANAWHQYTINAGRALLDQMSAEADTYLDTIRPAFDTAAATVAAALALDLDHNTSYADLIETGTPEQIDAWRAYLDARTTLDRIATTRIAMSAWLDLPPQGNANHANEVPDYTPAFVPANVPMKRDPEDLSPNAIAHRWLDLQTANGNGLHLAPVADLHAQGYATGRATSVA